MKYEKGTFTTVPNIKLLYGLDTQTQSLFMWLCHYANRDGKCFPSVSKLAESCKVSRTTIKEKIKYLIDLGLLEKEERFKNNAQTTNIYNVIIADKLNALNKENKKRKLSRTDQGGSRGDQGGGRVATTELNPVLTKTTDTNVSVANAENDSPLTGSSPQGFGEELPKNTFRRLDKNEDLLSKQIQEIMALFYEINPALNFANKTSRGAAEWMIKKWGIDVVRDMTKKVIECQGQEFAPEASTPYEMKEKLIKFKNYFTKRANNNKAYEI